jgi:hypothetical protein
MSSPHLLVVVSGRLVDAREENMDRVKFCQYIILKNMDKKA